MYTNAATIPVVNTNRLRLLQPYNLKLNGTLSSYIIQLVIKHQHGICILAIILLTSQLDLLAQSVERGADNAKVVSSILTQTTKKGF